MPETIILSFQLTKDLWQQFFEAHFNCKFSLKLRYFWGVICIVIGALGFGGFYQSKIIASLLLATGFYGVLSKYLLIYKSLRSAAKHPFYDKELTVAVTPDEISVRSENSGYSQPWGNFVGFRKLPPGFLLYHDQNAFFFIPSAGMTAGQIKQVLQVLSTSGVSDLAKGSSQKSSGN